MHYNTETENKLSDLFKEWHGSFPDNIKQLPHSGSSRIYYRITKDEFSAIGVFNDNYQENIAFIDFTRQLLNSKINVPAIYNQKLDKNIYLIQDLGNNLLLSWLISKRSNNNFPWEAIEVYKKVIQQLVQMQIVAGQNFDYSKCYQHPEFGKDSIIFDLNYFKTSFVDSLKLKYDKNKLDSDFETFAQHLLSAENKFFMFRDFQARNIILKQGVPYFIDYQGGRKGPLQYDLASLLFQAKAQIPENEKMELLEYYVYLAKMYTPIIANEFKEFFFSFALVRVLQTLGAYGLRGLKERKLHFIESIPLVKNNLIYLKERAHILYQQPELNGLINQIINTEIITDEQ